jgi:hypothetical protein
VSRDFAFGDETIEVESTMQDQPATRVFAALGYSLANEDLKGDFESARQCVQSWLVQSHQSADPLWQADALIWRAVVHILQGELLPAETCLDEAEQRAAGDVNRCVAYRHVPSADDV